MNRSVSPLVHSLVSIVFFLALTAPVFGEGPSAGVVSPPVSAPMGQASALEQAGPRPSFGETGAPLPVSPPGRSPDVVSDLPSDLEMFFNSPETLQLGSGERDMQERKGPPSSGNLKQFGYDFFRKGSGFIPDQQALVGPDYILGPGDTLRIDTWGNIEGTHVVTVDRSGQILLPKVGAIQVWGQTFDQARQTIQRQVEKYFTNFEINVTLGPIRSIHVYLVGEVVSPGTYQISSLSTVLTALSEAGGPSRTGSLRKVHLRRAGQVIAEIDFYDFFLKGDNSGANLRLQSGDTLFVPVAGPLVGVAGNVRRPAIYELSQKETLEQVLDLAGGIVSTAYLQKVTVERVETHNRRVVLDLDLGSGDEKALQTVMQDRDLIRIGPIAASGDFVSLGGFVSRPGNYQLFPGMKLSDLILPYDNLLPEYFPDLAQVVRRSPPEYRPEIVTVNLRAALNGDGDHNLLLHEFDEVRLFSRKEMEEALEVRVTGAVLNPGKYPLLGGMTVKDLVASAGNLRRMAYLPEAELTRFTPRGKGVDVKRTLIDLGKALQGDPEHNLLLQEDDHLFVRGIPEFGEKMIVEIHGEVVFPGQYVISRGERLSSVLERAGGFTGDAYLRGSLFSRESLKEMQRQRMERLMQEQEQAILTASSQMAQGALSPEDSRAAQALLENRRAMLEKMRQTPATGRMVVRLSSIEKLRGSEYDIELMGGDSLVVPKSPQSVSVLGQVYNQTALTFVPGDTVGDYLRKVGGITDDANRRNMFVVRADGTVVSRKQTRFLVFNRFNAVELHPGDAILVPERVRRTDVLKEVRDMSTIIYQMALGAAAVATFR